MNIKYFILKILINIELPFRRYCIKQNVLIQLFSPVSFHFLKMCPLVEKCKNYNALVTHIRFLLNSTGMNSNARLIIFKTHSITC